MKRISLEQLSKKSHTDSYEQLCQYVYDKVQAGLLKPVKASGTNGKKPALYASYWIVEEKKDYSRYKEELQYEMNTAISIDYYLRHPEQYEQDRPWVLKLNRYLFECQRNQGQSQSPLQISMNERSFQIWGREKFLRQEQGKKILKRCGIESAQLSFYDTTEPLAYYSHSRETPQKLLILENKDTFYSMRRYLLEGNAQILGMKTGTLIYGAGKGILRSFGDFSFCVEPYMQERENEIYYFGDLDYEGIGIYERLAESFADEREIRPFHAAYVRMLEKAKMADGLPKTKEKQNRQISGRFFAYFTDEEVGQMRKILEADEYIPQEILNIQDLQDKVKSDAI